MGETLSRLSVALRLTNPNRSCLILVENKVANRDRTELQWGLPAGGLGIETVWNGLKREFKEETGLNPRNISMTDFERKHPRVFVIPRIGNKEIVDAGMVFDGTYQFEGRQKFDFLKERVENGIAWKVAGDEEVVKAGFFGAIAVCELIDRDRIYKPEYNILSLTDWLVERKSGIGGVRKYFDKWIEEKKIAGLTSRRRSLNDELEYSYVPECDKDFIPMLRWGAKGLEKVG